VAQGTLFTAPSAQPACYARVAVERGIDRLDGDDALTYRVEGAAPPLGARVRVPLGRGSALAPGFVVRVGGPEVLGSLDPARVKPIATVEPARLPPTLLELGAWMASYYVCPLGLTLGAIAPGAVKAARTPRTDVALALLPPPADARPSKAARALLDALGALGPSAYPIALRDLARRLGLRTSAPLRRLAKSGWLRVESGDVPPARHLPDELPRAPAPRPEGPPLSPAQAAAVGGITPTPGAFAVHLLRGVTGSGKTEVYLRLIESALGRGLGAIVLVPEIALTPQTTARFTERFGEDAVAVLHSGVTPAQRRRAWERLSRGEARVAVGARSAVFAPVERLGIIVVDEEHDASYKQDRLPRYHARDVAIKRAQLAGAAVVLGSATPSLESWRHAAGPTPKYRLWELPDRVGGASLPEVRIVDWRDERRLREQLEGGPDPRQHLLGPTLERALEHTLARGRQAILLLNRRGMASHVWCRSPRCGFVLSCERCDANLVVHAAAGAPQGRVVRCHHCEHAGRVPVDCPMCHGALALFAGGTQRAEQELARKFASLGLAEGSTLLRVDSDSMRLPGAYAAALGAFARGAARVLIGTQMIAKGLDFPGVALVGVLDADTALHTPDFRAEERTFQLVSQVAGRAGRGAEPGLVIVQTSNPGARAVVLAARHDYPAFAREELAARERFGLPPAVRMARVICRDADHAAARARAGQIADALRGEGVTVRGPTPCAIARVDGKHRQAVDLFAPSAGAVQASLARARAAGLVTSDAATAVDVDPVALL
jgi:primosomal protein N' (replication factor Y)